MRIKRLLGCCNIFKLSFDKKTKLCLMSKRLLNKNNNCDEEEPLLKKRKMMNNEVNEQKQDDIFNCYEGEYNSNNEYDGFGKLIIKNNKNEYKKYIGNFLNGKFNGFGILFLNIDCNSMLIGNWINNELNGLSIMINECEYLIFGEWKNGDKNGENFKEFEFYSFEFDFNQFIYNKIEKLFDKRLNDDDDDDINCNQKIDINLIFKIWNEKYKNNLRLVFNGNYKNDERNGNGTLYFEDGGEINGKWINGILNDDNATYIFPNKKSKFVGKWKNGDMINAVFIDKNGKINNDISYCYDIATNINIGKYPLLKDKYEENRVYVKKSTIYDGGNGLFAKCDLDKNEIISFYNGLHIKHEIINNRLWCKNSNALTINCEFCVDIPNNLVGINKYCASLAHFANHNWLKQNCKYDTYYSPRFGDIKCLRTIKKIKKNTEIFVDYDYKNEWPQWYHNKFVKKVID